MLLACIALLILLGNCLGQGEEAMTLLGLVDMLSEPRLVEGANTIKTFRMMINGQLQMASMLANPSMEMTVLAPTDGAFAELGIVDPVQLNTILSLHLVKGREATPERLLVPKVVDTFHQAKPVNESIFEDQRKIIGTSLIARRVQEKVLFTFGVRKAVIALEGPFMASNGILYIVSGVITPPSSFTDSCRQLNVTLFNSLVQRYELQNWLQGATVFAPINEELLNAVKERPAEYIRALVKSHIVPLNMFYMAPLAAIASNPTVSTAEGALTPVLEVQRDANGIVTIGSQGATAITMDQIAHGTVMHVVSKPLFQQEADAIISENSAPKIKATNWILRLIAASILFITNV